MSAERGFSNNERLFNGHREDRPWWDTYRRCFSGRPVGLGAIPVCRASPVDAHRPSQMSRRRQASGRARGALPRRKSRPEFRRVRGPVIPEARDGALSPRPAAFVAPAFAEGASVCLVSVAETSKETTCQEKINDNDAVRSSIFRLSIKVYRSKECRKRLSRGITKDYHIYIKDSTEYYDMLNFKRAHKV